jgi:hypothetical protein
MDKVIVMAPMRVILRDFFLGPIFLGSFLSLVGFSIYYIYILGKEEGAVLPENETSSPSSSD